MLWHADCVRWRIVHSIPFRSALVVVTVIIAACSRSIADQPAQSPTPPLEHALEIAPEATRHPALRVPEGVRAEHERIHADLVEATKAPGSVGDAARELARVLHPHFLREEEIALPPLGLLVPLAAGEYSPEMQAVLPMTDALREELPQMLREHVQIAAAARRLEQASAEAGNHSAEALARALLAHAESEEQVYYPAATLVGDVVRAHARDPSRPTIAR